MAFTLSGSTITQSGTDTNLTGLSAIAGVSVDSSGIYTQYNLGSLALVVNGSLTIPTGSKLKVTGAAGITITINNGGTLNIGTANSLTKQNGSVITINNNFAVLECARATGNSYWSQFGLVVNSGGTLNVYGGYIYSNQTIKFYSGAIINIKDAIVYITANSTDGKVNWYNESSLISIDGLTIYSQSSALLFGLLTNISKLNNYKPIGNSFGFGVIDTLNFGTISVDNFQGGLSKTDIIFRTTNDTNKYIVNGSNLGNSLSVSGHGGGTSRGYVEHNIRYRPTITDSTGKNNISNAVLYLKDTNNNLRSPISGQNQSTKTYLLQTSTDGRPPQTLILTGCFHNNGNASVNLFSLDDRLPVSGYVYAYAYIMQSISVIDSTLADQIPRILLATDTNVTLTETNAISKLTSSFVVNTATNTISVIANSTLDDLYDVMKVWKTRNVQAQLEYPSIDTQPVTASGDTLTTSMSVIGIEFLTAGVKFKKLQATCTANGTISNLSINGNVNQEIPTNLNNVVISGTLTYNTNSNTTITIANTTINTVENIGTGIITINKVSSTVTNYVDAEINFMDSSISVIGADTVTIHPTANDRDLNQNVSVTFTSTYLFKYGSLVNDSTMGGTLYLRCVAGGIPFNVDKNIVLGDNVKDLGMTALLSSLGTKIDNKPTLAQIEASSVLAKKSQVEILNRNTIKASKLIPASEIF